MKKVLNLVLSIILAVPCYGSDSSYQVTNHEYMINAPQGQLQELLFISDL